VIFRPKATIRYGSRHRGVTVTLVLLLTVQSLCCARTLRGQTEQSRPPTFRDLSSQANAARDADQLDKAVLLYKKALALRPAWTEGWWSLGTILYDQNAYAVAAKSFRKVVVLDPNAGTAWVMLGLCEFELGREDSALAHLEKGQSVGIANDPQLWRVVFYHEGELLRRGGKFTEAATAFNRLCADGVQSDNVSRGLGMTALRIRTPSASALDPRAAKITLLTGRAECLAAQSKFEEARRNFQALVERYPEFTSIHYAYGKFLLQVHDTSGATQEFEKEIENNPGDVLARLEIAAIRYRVDSAKGIPFAQEAVKLNPNLPFGHYLLGLLLLDTLHYRAALRELAIARPAFAAVPNFYFALGTAYSRLGRKQEAARAWATFKRLRREAEKSGPLYYGQQPSGLQAKLGP
jgi:tetratricopeptide (TPR) repeat protein